MKDIFLSRPTWVDPMFAEGLKGFLHVLEGLDLKPRTIGTTDYPNKSPLDEVIRLMDECTGAIILGYPQIVAESGHVKDKPITRQIVLPTEWNHIEASLAYARRIPLLVIHHNGVSRGVFDRGAISSFIYEIDLAIPGWALRDEIHGALKKWKADILGSPSSGSAVHVMLKTSSTPMATTANDALVYYCSRCGTVPGTPSECTFPYSSHTFLKGTSETFCHRCAAKPGTKKACTFPNSSHDFR